jgi:hypothetical protein
MTSFKLEQKSTGKALTCFRVLDERGSIYGSVNIPNEAVRDFLARWKSSAPTNAAKQPSAAAALSAAFKRAKPRMSKAGVLRGC